MNNSLLQKLYLTHSPSKKEDRMSTLIQEELENLKLSFKQGPLMMLYSITPGTPLMVAHMDQIQTTKCDKVMTFKDKIYGFTNSGKLSGLGADDKNGIFIILDILRQHREQVSFIFTSNEECGGYLHHLMDKIDISHNPYALVFDRKGAGDIIGTSNNYCCDDLETAVATMGKPFGYKPANGIFSDCNELSKHIPCINLSCGYYSAHTEEEHTKPAELWNAMKFANELIRHLPKKGRPFEMPTRFSEIDRLPASTTYASYSAFSKSYNKTATVSTKPIKQYKTWAEKEERAEIENHCLVRVNQDGSVEFINECYSQYDEETIANSIEEAEGEWITDMGTLSIRLYMKLGEPMLIAVLEGIEIDVITEQEEKSPEKFTKTWEEYEEEAEIEYGDS